MTPVAYADVAEFAGDWTLELTLVARAHVPALGDFVTRTRSELAVRLDVDGVRVRQAQRTCSVTVNDGRGLVRTRIPAAFVAALPEASFPVSVAWSAGAWRYAADFGRQVVGWSGEGPLPADAGDDRLRDDDGDGAPGVTVRVEAPIVGAGDVWVVQAGRTTAAGTWDGGAFRGGVTIPEWRQAVVGASEPWLLRAPELAPDAPASAFVLRPGPASCAR